ncbi:MAG: type II toxin-antitoxin system prevent-host-death family antitoxin [Alphaproteobacteria bacterium]
MEVIPMHQAKSTLSQLVKRAASGETILIGAYGKAEARLVSVISTGVAHKQIGILAGKLVVPDDFDAPLQLDILDAFEGVHAPHGAAGA